MSNDVLDALSPSQARLYNKLVDFADVKICVLFRALKGRWPEASEPNRVQQQLVSVYVTRANRKLADHGLRIAPGIARNTYRLYRL